MPGAVMQGKAALANAPGWSVKLAPRLNPLNYRVAAGELYSGVPRFKFSAPANVTAPGSFGRVIEGMSDRAAIYQSRISGRLPDVGYTVRGTKFDGFDQASGILLDAKGPGYATFVRNGQFEAWFGGADDLVAQAQRQLRAANGTPIRWHFAEDAAADATRRLLQSRGILSIDIVFTP